ncbi:MAG TPA: cobalamin-binding protein [Nitrospira sp.]|nr:cobalamin-binding protein [Nitrospira sp.]
MRICSLVPGATEVVAMLGLSDHLVGISHECDYPPTVRQVPIMVNPVVNHEVMRSADIDRRVKALVSSGGRLYSLHEQAFLDARPDVILAQDLCHVCAVTPDQLEQAIQMLPSRPRMVTLNPASLFDVINDVARIGTVLGEPALGRELAQSLLKRVAAVRARSAIWTRPRVLCLEWLSPPYIGGHWVPELVHLAGGQDVLGQAGQPSRQVTWDEVRAAAPDVVVVMPCGFSVARTVSELMALWRTDNDCSRALTSWPKTYVVDASSYFSRPGPRLVDGVELLADVFSGNISPHWDSSIIRDITGSDYLIGQSV